VKNRTILAIGIALAILLPPGLPSFFVGLLLTSLTGQFPPIYDPSDVVSDLPFFFIVYLLVEVVFAVTLFRRGSRRTGWGLAALAVTSAVLGSVAFLSTMTCGFC